ncbi:hypothetical protein GYMLUDRAFT_98264 [Collybiopsis luxurians FD-317 M1]|uniref:Uncharacterized protein n=1 Tax=Collybiopsis luxurians FD-317 M1 TaxID=944289 RepID=A0A0D0C6A2_9AGAR|nr:hypothetical protein GYMLUDRAFT_98264 [Collybiopsis luxurians FD-317 M1]
MIGLVAATLTGLTWFLLCVTAVPFPGVANPQDRELIDEGWLSRRLAFKPREDKIGSSCTNLTVNELKTLPGWSKIEDFGDKQYSKKKRNYLTYDEKESDVPGAQVCVAAEKIKIRYTGVPTCSSSRSNVGGQLDGSHGIVSVAVEEGYKGSMQYTVSQAATLGVMQTYQASVEFEEIAGLTDTTAVSASITNTLTKSFTAEFGEMVTSRFNVTVPEDKQCHAKLNVTTCTIQGTGELKLIASGNIWFEYYDRVKGHYKYVKPLEEILPKVNDRSSSATFKGSITATTKGQYSGKCE